MKTISVPSVTLPTDFCKVVFYSGTKNVLEMESYKNSKNEIIKKTEDFDYLTENKITQIVVIVNDSCVQSPRDEWDNAGTIVSLVNRDFGSDKDASPLYVLRREKDNDGKFYYERQEIDRSYVKRIDDYCKNNVAVVAGERACILPIYMYNHSGCTIKTSPFSCPWDSGLVGYIYMTAEKAKKEQFTKGNKVDWKRVVECLKSEVHTYNQYLTGEVYGFQSYSVDTEAKEITETDSCYGFFGYTLKDMEEHYLPSETTEAK